MAGKTYEEEMKRLEEIVEKISNGQVTLSESLKLFEEGEALSKSIADKLKDFEGKIKVLDEKTGKFADAIVED